MIAKLKKAAIDQQWILSRQVSRRESDGGHLGLGLQVTGNLFRDQQTQGVGGDALLLSEIRQSVRESSNGKSSRVSSDLSKRNLFHLITFIINEVGKDQAARSKGQEPWVALHWICPSSCPVLLSRDLGTMLGCCLGVGKVHQFRLEDVLEVVAWLGG